MRPLALRAPGDSPSFRKPSAGVAVGQPWSLPREDRTLGEGDRCSQCLPPLPGPAAAAAPSAPVGPGPYLTAPPGSPPDRASAAGDQVGQREHCGPAPSPSELHGRAQPWAPRDEAAAPGAGRATHPGTLGLECSGHRVLQEVRRAREGGAGAWPLFGALFSKRPEEGLTYTRSPTPAPHDLTRRPGPRTLGDTPRCAYGSASPWERRTWAGAWTLRLPGPQPGQGDPEGSERVTSVKGEVPILAGQGGVLCRPLRDAACQSRGAVSLNWKGHGWGVRR